MTEPAREILHPQDEHETYCEMDEKGSKCEVSDRSLQVPAVREVYTVNGQVTPRLCKSTSSRVVTVVKYNLAGLVTNTTVSELEVFRSRTVRTDDWDCRRDGDETPRE